MVFADTEHIEPDLIGVFDLFDQVAHARRRIDGAAVLVERRSETVNPDLHLQVRLSVWSPHR